MKAQKYYAEDFPQERMFAIEDSDMAADDRYFMLGIDQEPYMHIKWQTGGGRGENGEKNGAYIEDVLLAAYRRLYRMNDKYPCRENSLALTKIQEAVMWLDARTADRDYRGVLGEEKA